MPIKTCCAAAVLAVGTLGIVAAASADDCAALIAAEIAQVKQPYKGSFTMTLPGQAPVTSQTVSIGGKVYVQLNGQWQSTPMPVDETVARINENMKNATTVCQKSGTETLNGESTTVYSAHSVTKRGTTDSRIWISDRRGLPVKLETDVGSGSGVSQTFSYDNVQAPTGVP